MRYATAFNTFLFAGLVLIVSALALGRVRHADAVPQNLPDLMQGRLARTFESHYDEAFPVRNFGVNLWAAIDYEVFGEGRPGVVLGRDGWLYTDEEFKLGNGARAELARNLALVGWVHRELARRGIALLVAVVPAKARVYPEHLDRRVPPALHRALYAEAAAALRREGIAAADLLAPLEHGKAEAPTYLRTDTHWTPFGARLAAAAIAARATGLASPPGGRAFRTTEGGERTHRGDLLGFLPLDPYFASLLPPPDRIAETHTEPDGSGGGDLLGDAAPAAVALVGTSYSANPLWNFAGALEQALGADVMNYARNGAGPFAPMLDYLRGDDLRRSPPKLVVWELPERYLPAHAALDDFHLPAEAFAPHAASVASTASTAKETTP